MAVILIFISPLTHLRTSSFVTSIVSLARFLRTILVNASGSWLDMMSSSASGEKSRFLLAASVRTSFLDTAYKWGTYRLKVLIDA